MVPVICLSSANCLQTSLCIIFRRGFLLGWQPCRPIWCSVRHMVWALTGWPPTPSTSAAMLAALICLFPKHNLWIWCWAHALNFFGWPWRVWSCPLCCSSVSGSWQSYSLRHLYVEQHFFFSVPLEFFAMRCHVETSATGHIQWLVWESESDNTTFNIPAPHSHLRPCNINELHDTGERKWLIMPNLVIFT